MNADRELRVLYELLRRVDGDEAARVQHAIHVRQHALELEEIEREHSAFREYYALATAPLAHSERPTRAVR